MEKWVLFLLIAGIVTSHLNSPKEKTENSSIMNSQKESTLEIPEINEALHNTSELPINKSNLNERHFLFVSTDKGIAEKAIIAKLDDDTQKVEVASFSKDEINQLLVDVDAEKLKDFPKDKHISNVGISIDHIIVIDKKGYNAMFTKLFPEGIPINLTEAMRKELNLEDQKNYIDAEEFLKTIKSLKATQKYDHELNQIIVNTFSTQLSKPDIVLSLFGVVTEFNKYFYTDLTMEELLSIGLNMMKNPVQEVQKLELELPSTLEQEVIKESPIKLNPI